MIESDQPSLSVRRQCELIGLNRSTLYYTLATESEFNLKLMRLIDEEYTRRPFYGRPRLTDYLRRLGYEINPKRVRRLMQKMGLEAIYPKPKTTISARGHKKYPYLLRGLEISRTNPWRRMRFAPRGLERRYHVYSNAAGLHVSDGNHRLVQPVRNRLGVVE